MSEDLRWAARPVLSTLARGTARALPVLAALGSAVAASRMVGRPSGLAASAAWWTMVVTLATVVLLVVDRMTGRLVALAALLRLELAFPGRPPSRTGVAFRAGRIRNLAEQLAWAKQEGANEEPGPAAERILTLVGALNVHDRGTRGHSDRVRAFNDLIAEQMGLAPPERDRLRWAALVHDIGKLHVPSRLLSKPGRPSGREWEQLQSHPVEGARIVAPLGAWLGDWVRGVEEHHERWDGTGYPNGRRGEEISLSARIVAVADTFEVMTAPRPYRLPVNAVTARDELARCAGNHFDPTVVRAFLDIPLGRLRWAMGPLSWFAYLPLFRSMPRYQSKARAATRSAAATAGTATGVGALAMSGIMGSASATATSPAPRPPALREAANLFAAATSRLPLSSVLDSPPPSVAGSRQGTPADAPSGAVRRSATGFVADEEQLLPASDEEGDVFHEEGDVFEEVEEEGEVIDELEFDEEPAADLPAPVLAPPTTIERDDVSTPIDGGEEDDWFGEDDEWLDDDEEDQSQELEEDEGDWLEEEEEEDEESGEFA